MLPVHRNTKVFADTHWFPSSLAALACGVATSLLMALHAVSLLLPAMAQTTDLDALALTLGVALLVPGMLCVRLSPALSRGQLDAQKRVLGCVVVILGLALPMCAVEPLAIAMALPAAVCIALLLGSRSETSAPPAAWSRY
jgi:hypothetical protein